VPKLTWQQVVWLCINAALTVGAFILVLCLLTWLFGMWD